MLDSPLPAGGATSTMPLTTEEMAIYSRQMVLPEIGLEGQAAMKRARVLVVGAGGLGSPVLLYLAAAGVGTLGIVEFDMVDLSNLHRQVLFGNGSVGQPKAQAAAARLRPAYPWLKVTLHETRLDRGNITSILAGYDLVVDATDNFTARYLISDACVAAGKTNISASILRFEGQVSVFDPSRGPCYRCVFPEAPPPDLAPSCAEAGVLGVLPGVIGLIQATEVLKLLLGVGRPLVGRLLVYDAHNMRFREFTVVRNPDCAACGPDVRQDLLGTVPLAAGSSDAEPVEEVTATALAEELRSGRPIVLLDVRTETERSIARIGTGPLIPLAELEEKLAELPRDISVVCYCHKGARSRRAAALLQRHGFPAIRSLRGGVDAWSQDVDRTVSRY